jgi:hypothetical protein
VVSGVDVDGDAVEVCAVVVAWGGCSTLVMVGVLFSFSCSALCMAPATACS